MSVKSENNNTAPIAHGIYPQRSNEQERLEELFKTLDADGNGKIDIRDLSEALKDSQFGQQYAEVRYCEVVTDFTSLTRVKLDDLIRLSRTSSVVVFYIYFLLETICCFIVFMCLRDVVAVPGVVSPCRVRV